MKVIDIYNKIANGEKVPKFKLKNTKEDNYYWVDRLGTLVYSQSGLPDTYELTNIRYDLLNDEVEIIEDKPKEEIQVLSRWYPPKEDKKIEKLDMSETHYMIDHTEIMEKINEIIDRLNGE